MQAVSQQKSLGGLRQRRGLWRTLLLCMLCGFAGISIGTSHAQTSAEWRFQYFGNVANTGSGADLTDGDADGLSNLLEYALARNPLSPDSSWTAITLESGNIVMRYTRRKAALSEVTFSFITATSPTGPWTNGSANSVIQSDDGTFQSVRAEVSMAGEVKKFVRLVVQRLPIPEVPSNLVAVTTSPTATSLTWVDNAASESGYRLERKRDGGAFSLLTSLGANVTSFTDTGLIAGSNYTYRLVATNSTGDSGFVEASVTMEFLLNVAAALPVTVGSAAGFSANAGGGPVQYSWNFGDGSTFASSSGSATHTYAGPGHYQVIVRATRGSETDTVAFIQTVHWPVTAQRPTNSTAILIDEAQQRVWNVNPDADTVTAIDMSSLTKQFEKPVGAHPQSIAQAPDGSLWVVNENSATISILARQTGNLLTTVALPKGSLPHSVVFSPDGNAAYVSLQGTGKLVRFNPATRAITGTITVGASPRALAVSHDSQRILVTRLISPADRGEITEVSAASFTVARTMNLLMDSTAFDGGNSGRGVPNYLVGITISPDGRRAWVPSQKANTLRGQFRDGQPLTFDTTVRTITSQIDLMSNQENFQSRIDFNDRDFAYAVQFSPLGDYAFIALQGSNMIEVRNAYTGSAVSGAVDCGMAPQGLVLTSNGSRLFVHNFMSRTVRVYDTTGVINSTTLTMPVLATIACVTTERLAPQVLQGKQIFYNAKDPRMSREGYISCASCHLDGGQDGRVWDFTDRGEGFRNTTSLKGRRGMGHGRVHWTGNFDEIQDFENDIRAKFGGLGFMSNTAFNSGTRSVPLGDLKAGLSPELDALAAYVSSLDTIERSPFRNEDNSLTSDALAGKQIFQQLNCASCHAGPDFTDSATGVLHNVGTIQASSGKRIGGTLTGLDTPTLRGLWATAPYFHDGSAATLGDVLTHAAMEPNSLHGPVSTLNASQRAQLAAYLLQIDEVE